MNDNYIEIAGARVNNLKNISLRIPRNRFIVVSGLSGSGKSSLAFDTLYAEGKRRYVESLSAYARQFVGKMSKPECDYIKGIPPAIAIEQRVTSRNPRSTVGTSTEIYDYMRMLYARVGKTISPISGKEVQRHSTADVLLFIQHSLSEGARYMITAPIKIPEGRTVEAHLGILSGIGYSRILFDGEVVRISDIQDTKDHSLSNRINNASRLFIVVDRLSAVSEYDDSTLSRITDAIETCFFEGRGSCMIFHQESPDKIWQEALFSDRFEADGMEFEEPSDNMFSFNSPVGACPTCEGFSKIIGIDPELVIPDKNRSVYDNCVACWRGEKMSEMQREFIQKAVEKYDFPIHKAYKDLSPKQQDLLWNGDGEIWGIYDFFKYLEDHPTKMHYRILSARYKGKTTCPTCKGKRLKKEALYVQVGGKNIAELVDMSIWELKEFLNRLKLSVHDEKVAGRILTELRNRVSFLVDIGLGYLTCSRTSNTLSGGETQRIHLSTALGSSLIGSLYILDEPSIGLHARDTHLLIDVLRRLTSIGNTVMVVEHDEDVILSADEIIDIGPDAGRNGGEVVYQGSPHTLPKTSRSHTVEYLSGRAQLSVPGTRRIWQHSIGIKGAHMHNLKHVDVDVPLQILTVITGVSGSGKSTLIREILYEGVKRRLEQASMEGILCENVDAPLEYIERVEYVDQNAIGKSSRSNPVTYVGAYDDIRKLYAFLPASKQMGYTPAHFSFNKEGGRCEACKGEGSITVEMQFMADISLICEECHGKRFQDDILEIRFENVSIADLLEMTVNQAIEFFSEHSKSHTECKKISEKLTALQDVGLGYIKLGQSSSTLSGGENQRVKLAYYLSNTNTGKTLFIFDEPTTGLHVHDIYKLIKTFDALIAQQHSIIVVEHNMEIIKCADYIIDLGPEGGDKGGYIVATGTPEEIAQCKEGYTGYFLKEKLHKS
ncbi:excinuclease ABC subunit UvrA [Porphyromonas sp. COT-108 OH1349]|uniref:excinuclease ABC subunit UvrA n=1 Tax=Porphyromonas sp. COT-108 OH1349 TaxID=1537504 RepID=UPI00052CCAFD|nr:excinuclease ABC subunit UvrA [Porphyromonas sp. COT-108 OH1349]KGN67922.1 excinuclease ABC subunit A [Porphyromonas sp. COT-108 OH1349]